MIHVSIQHFNGTHIFIYRSAKKLKAKGFIILIKKPMVNVCGKIWHGEIQNVMKYALLVPSSL